MFAQLKTDNDLQMQANMAAQNAKFDTQEEKNQELRKVLKTNQRENVAARDEDRRR